MELSIDCLPCLLGQAVRLAKVHLPSELEQRKLIKKIMLEMANIDEHASAPYVTQKIQQALKKILDNPDPYQQDKIYYNREMLKLEAELGHLIELSENPLHSALKLAAAGNVIDFGPGYDLSREKVLKTISETLKKEFQHDVFIELKTSLQKAKTLLYLGDNAGEVVFDKIFIQTIKDYYPNLDIYFATRGQPILNDITEEDAYLVGMDKYARIINNGTDIPGTVLECCSAAFRQVFEDAEVIIAKGQGNFESLYETGPSNLYYIFLCKCSLFMNRLGAQQNDIILMKE